MWWDLGEVIPSLVLDPEWYLRRAGKKQFIVIACPAAEGGQMMSWGKSTTGKIGMLAFWMSDPQ